MEEKYLRAADDSSLTAKLDSSDPDLLMIQYDNLEEQLLINEREAGFLLKQDDCSPNLKPYVDKNLELIKEESSIFDTS